LKGTGWKQNTIRCKLRIIESDNEDKVAPTAYEAAPVEESGCESGDERD
jgi:hypothetical protein